MFKTPYYNEITPYRKDSVFLSAIYELSPLRRITYLKKSALFLGWWCTLLLWVCEAWCAAPPFQLPAQPEVLRLKSARIVTNRGELYFELYPEDAPWHVANFKYLADKGFYKNLPFHIYYPNYIIQGGAPRGKPDGGPGYTLPPEFSSRKHVFGTLGMARRPNPINLTRASNGSQFHILLGEAPHMDGSYTIFGGLIKGADVLEQLRKGDLILQVDVYVTKGSVKDDS